MGVDDWHDPSQLALVCLLRGAAMRVDEARRCLLLFNPAQAPVPFALPAGHWQVALDSSVAAVGTTVVAADNLLLGPHTLMVLRCTAT
jgi:hypothetical protein